MSSSFLRRYLSRLLFVLISLNEFSERSLRHPVAPSVSYLPIVCKTRKGSIRRTCRVVYGRVGQREGKGRGREEGVKAEGWELGRRGGGSGVGLLENGGGVVAGYLKEMEGGGVG